MRAGSPSTIARSRAATSRSSLASTSTCRRHSVGAGDRLRINVQSHGFDLYLILDASSGQQCEIEDSDEGDTGPVRTALQTDESGSWSIEVTSYAPGGTGSDTLTRHAAAEQPVNAGPSPPPAATPSPTHKD